MRHKQSHVYTAHLKEFSDIKSDYDCAKKSLVSSKRKLRTLEQRYKFLYDIISERGTGDILELGCKRLFNLAGFNDVRHLRKVKPEREDLQIWLDDMLILVECKGIGSHMPNDADLNQIVRYVNYKATNSLLPVKGIVIFNHDLKKPIDKRNKTPIDKMKEEYAKTSGYGVIHVSQLINGFIQLKNNQINLVQFKDTLLTTGIVKFGDQ